MGLLITLVVFVLVLALCCWIVSLVPLPASPPWLRNVLYILVALIAIVALLQFTGLLDHRPFTRY
jgi:hypothetical protein